MTAAERTKPNYGRRILWLGVFAVLLVAGYSAGWFYLAGLLEARAKATIARAERRRRDGRMRQPGCARLSVPARHLLRPRRLCRCRRGVGFSAGGFRSAGQIYDPMRFVAELDGPATLDTPRNGSLKLDWERLRASVRLGRAAARARLGGRRKRWRRASPRARRSRGRRLRGAYAPERRGSRSGRQFRRAGRSIRPWSTAGSCRPSPASRI